MSLRPILRVHLVGPLSLMRLLLVWGVFLLCRTALCLSCPFRECARTDCNAHITICVRAPDAWCMCTFACRCIAARKPTEWHTAFTAKSSVADSGVFYECVRFSLNTVYVCMSRACWSAMHTCMWLHVSSLQLWIDSDGSCQQAESRAET